jgi:hypothetical protein
MTDNSRDSWQKVLSPGELVDQINAVYYQHTHHAFVHTVVVGNMGRVSSAKTYQQYYWQSVFLTQHNIREILLAIPRTNINENGTFHVTIVTLRRGDQCACVAHRNTRIQLGFVC